MTDNQIQAAVIYEMLITLAAKIQVYDGAIGYLEDLINTRLAQESDYKDLYKKFIDDVRDLDD